MSNNTCPRCGMLALVRYYEVMFCLLCGTQIKPVPVNVRSNGIPGIKTKGK